MLKNLLAIAAIAMIAVPGGCVSAASTPQWPFDQPPLEQLNNSPKKVFIHYFSPFPISIDNRQPDKDYYARGFLSPDGENGKHKSYGGFFRERPLPRLPRKDEDWVLEDMIDEVKIARELGADGF
jgi:hypothetical protein